MDRPPQIDLRGYQNVAVNKPFEGSRRNEDTARELRAKVQSLVARMEGTRAVEIDNATINDLLKNSTVNSDLYKEQLNEIGERLDVQGLFKGEVLGVEYDPGVATPVRDDTFRISDEGEYITVPRWVITRKATYNITMSVQLVDVSTAAIELSPVLDGRVHHRNSVEVFEESKCYSTPVPMRSELDMRRESMEIVLSKFNRLVNWHKESVAYTVFCAEEEGFFKGSGGSWGFGGVIDEFEKAEAFVSSGMWDGAIVSYTQALEALRKDGAGRALLSRAHHNLGVAYMFTGTSRNLAAFDTALQHFTTALDLEATAITFDMKASCEREQALALEARERRTAPPTP